MKMKKKHGTTIKIVTFSIGKIKNGKKNTYWSLFRQLSEFIINMTLFKF